MADWNAKIMEWSSDPRNIEKVRDSCPFHVFSHGVMGFGFGGFLGMFLASMSAGGTAPEARLLNPNLAETPALPLRMQVKHALGDLVKRSWSSAKNFGMIAAIYSGSECVIEGYRAKHDIVNSLSAGCFTGAVLSAKGGPKAALMGCAGFAAFSAAVEHFMQEKS